MLNRVRIPARILLVGFSVMALAGCATREEVARALDTAERAEAKADQAMAAANAAKASADSASAKADRALSAAEAAQRDIRAVDEKTERMYQRGLRKER
jgi:hypothetical protein